MINHLFLIIIGFIFLIKSADYLVYGASNIAKKFHIPETIIGLTVVSIGTSMPELVVSVTSSLSGHSDIAIGNVIGSNLANIFLILGICSSIKNLYFQKETRYFETPFTIMITFIFFFMCTNGTANEHYVITRSEGCFLIAVCGLFIFYNIIMSKKGEEFDYDYIELLQLELNSPKNIPIFKSILLVIIGIFGLKIGGDLVVNSAVKIATTLGLSEVLISLTIVAFSTSLPELITSITATIKGETDMAIGNVLGSQIFNILLIIGTSSVLNPITYSFSYNKDILLLIFGAICLGIFPFVGKKNYMVKRNGVFFTTIYLIYMSNLIYSHIT